jgi:hypothetical protein
VKIRATTSPVTPCPTSSTCDVRNGLTEREHSPASQYSFRPIRLCLGVGDGQVCQRVVPAKTLHVGQNATRPPPCMRWRGPCLASPPRIGQLPGLPGAARRPPAPDTRAIHRFPGPFPRPRSCPQMVPVSNGESISTPPASRRARVCGHSFQVSSLSTRCPQNKAAYPHFTVVIHGLLHKKSTGDVM